MYACLIPQFRSAPERVDASQTTITIKWSEPENNGCPLIGFSIFRNQGAGDDMNIEVDASQVTFKPSLRQYTITGLTQTGYTYQIKVRAYNADGYSDSPTLYAILAAAPD